MESFGGKMSSYFSSNNEIWGSKTMSEPDDFNREREKTRKSHSVGNDMRVSKC